MNLQKLTPNLMVEDVNATLAYYQDVFGFELEQSVPSEGQFDWASARRGEVELMFQSRSSLGKDLPDFQDLPIGGSLTFFIVLQGIQELYERVRGQAEVVQDLHDTFYGMREFATKDLNGYILTFAEPIE
jgi:uncharacterized glyoxalase superfamily protein PhnB